MTKKTLLITLFIVGTSAFCMAQQQKPDAVATQAQQEAQKNEMLEKQGMVIEQPAITRHSEKPVAARAAKAQEAPKTYMRDGKKVISRAFFETLKEAEKQMILSKPELYIIE